MPDRPKPDEALPASVTFDYIKSPHFRVIHVDGAIGAITPRGLIHAALYSERPAIPTRMTHKIQSDMALGEAIETEGRPGVVREIEVDLMLDLATATSLRDWLKERIEQLESQIRISREGVSKR